MTFEEFLNTPLTELARLGNPKAHKLLFDFKDDLIVYAREGSWMPKPKKPKKGEVFGYDFLDIDVDKPWGWRFHWKTDTVRDCIEKYSAPLVILKLFIEMTIGIMHQEGML